MARIDMPEGANVAVPGEYSLVQAPISNKGNPTSGGFNNLMIVEQNQPVRLVDNNGDVIFEGVGPEAARQAVVIGQGISDTQGNKAGYEIQTVPVGTETFKAIATEKVNQSTLDAVGDVLGDTALGFLAGGPLGAALAAGASIGGVNVSDIAYPIIGAMTPLGPIAGAAAGSAASGAVQGRPIEDILTRAAITAGTAGIMKGTPVGKSISKGIGSALSDLGLDPFIDNVVRAVSENAIPQAVGDEIIVNAITDQLGSGVASGVIGSAVGSGLSSVAPPPAAINPTPAVDQIPETIVTGQRPVDVVSGIGGSVVADGAVKPTADNPFPENTLVEAGQEPPPVTAGIGGVTGGGTDPVTGEQNEIIVTKDGEVIGLTPPIIPDVGPFDVSTDITNTVKDVQVPSAQKPMTAADYIKLGLNAAGLLGALGGGGGGDGGTLGPDNSAISYTPLNRQQRTRAPSGAGLGDYGFDPFTYGQASGNQPGEYLFFEAGPAIAPVTPAVSAPSGALQFAEGGSPNSMSNKDLVASFTSDENNPAIIREINQRIQDKLLDRFNGDRKAAAAFLRETNDPLSVLNDYAEGGDVDDDMVKHLIEYRKGGGHNGPGKVKGIGSGQEDKIPAWLSDGEYVWSAQDVADLGDGSTDEGVRRLDKMRQMVRHRAGRKDVKKIAKPQKGIDALLAAVGGK